VSRWVYGRADGLTVYATDDPYMAEVVATDGRRVLTPVFVLLKFGWELDEPPGWPGTDAHGRAVTP
jgi:hypothetical protein